MSTKTSLYDVLGVPSSADAKQIRAAYLTKVKQHHPDKGGSSVYFREVREAYIILSDEKARDAYDRVHQSTKSNMDETYVPAIHVIIRTPLDHVPQHFKREIDVIVQEKCKRCNGSGGSGNYRRCVVCSGYGTLRSTGGDAYALWDIRRLCTTCNGAGSLRWLPCVSCNGKKTFECRKNILVYVPHEHNFRRPIVLSGQGHLQRGDIVVHIRSLPRDSDG